jgi:hypothetical protein
MSIFDVGGLNSKLPKYLLFGERKKPGAGVIGILYNQKAPISLLEMGASLFRQVLFIGRHDR